MEHVNFIRVKKLKYRGLLQFSMLYYYLQGKLFEKLLVEVWRVQMEVFLCFYLRSLEDCSSFFLVKILLPSIYNFQMQNSEQLLIQKMKTVKLQN